MKTPSSILRWGALLTFAFGSVSCMTTYDSAGRPVQSVDPVAATAGIAAAGLIGYALANDNRHKHYRSGYRGHRRDHYRGGYRGHYYGPPRCY